MSRLVIVISTQDNGRNEINTSATKWGELKRELEAANVRTDNMKAMVRDSKTTLEHTDAQLPEGNFTLFLTPGKVKSGN